MEQFTLLNFFTISIPESIAVAIFTWVILDKIKAVRFPQIIVMGVVTAIVQAAIYIVLYPNLDLFGPLQIAAYTIIIYFILRLNYIEAMVGSLMSSIIILVTQVTVFSTGYLISGSSFNDLPVNSLWRVLYCAVEIAIISVLSLALYRKNIKITINFNKNTTNKFLPEKIRFLVLQLTFTLVIAFTNYKMVFFALDKFKTIPDKGLLVVNFSAIAIFTVIIIKSAFKIGEGIQIKEELKSKLEIKEFAQNIDYLWNLIRSKKYDEAENMIESIQYEIDNRLEVDILNNKAVKKSLIK